MIAAHDSPPPLRIYSQFLIVGGKEKGWDKTTFAKKVVLSQPLLKNTVIYCAHPKILQTLVPKFVLCNLLHR